jgi:hypothetical protein
MIKFERKFTYMNISIKTQRDELLHYIEIVDDIKIKAFYILLEKEIKNELQLEYTAEFKAELDNRYDGYKSGKTQMITSQESKARIHKLLNEKSSK